MPQRRVSIARRFEGLCHFHFQGFKVREGEGDTFLHNVGRGASRSPRRRRYKSLRIRISRLPHARYVSRFSHSTWWGIRSKEIIPFLLIQFFPSSSFFLFSTSKYSYQQAILFI